VAGVSQVKMFVESFVEIKVASITSINAPQPRSIKHQILLQYSRLSPTDAKTASPKRNVAQLGAR